jgi:NAD(P)-dependent dehydrogenase (short-subunit alcohol dehydrogenase family)
MVNAVITGSTKGIGYALAQQLVRRGHAVVVSGRTQAAVDEAVEKLGLEAASGGRAAGQVVDVSDAKSVQSLWDASVAALGSVDLWINNAGVAYTMRTIAETTPDEVSTMVSTNMLGTIYGSQVALRGMSASGGQLFNILGGGSDGSVRPGMGVYSTTKRGLDMFTKALVKEVEGTSVRVGQVRPGILITDGWLREAATSPESVQSQRKMVNILSDHVDDVAPFLVEKMLSSTKNGDEIAWLTTSRMMKKFLGKKDDKLARYGL